MCSKLEAQWLVVPQLDLESCMKNYALSEMKGNHQNTSYSLSAAPVAVWAQADWTPSGTTTQGHFVCAGGPADGRLVPGDQLVKINNVSVDDLTPEQATEIIRSAQTAAFTNTHAYAWWLVHTLQLFKIKQCIPCVILTPSLSVLFFFFRECPDTLTMTVLRTMLVSLPYLSKRNTPQRHTQHKQTYS